jgi:hypothetical protein
MQYRNSQHLAPMIQRPYRMVGIDRDDATIFPDLIHPIPPMTVPHFLPTKSIKRIQLQECAKAGITLEEMLSDSRASVFAEPRMRAMARAVVETGKTRQVIGRAFGRDHSTVSHAYRKFRGDHGPR